MIELTHSQEPSKLADYRRQSHNFDWSAQAFNPVREIVRHQLNAEQQGCCIYCEQELGPDDGHVEHISSKKGNQALTFDYGNLAHSCNSKEHCGHKKQSQVIPIEPRANCNQNFFLSLVDGRLVPSIGASKQERSDVENTVKILGLNSPSLTWTRKSYAESFQNLDDPGDRSNFLATSPFRWTLKANLANFNL